MIRRIFKALALIVAAFVAVAFVVNTDLLAPESAARPLLIAHRGLGQTYSREGLENDTCTAERIFAPEHPYLENTIEGFEAAFAAGADIVEFDVHPTTDGQFAVFHDWTVDCRTEGSGVTREHSLAELKALDVGYGYTADGGRTFPFRGKGGGLMPSLDEVLEAFPDRRFLINIKSNDEDEGRLLAARLNALPPERRADITIYGGGRAVEAFKADSPQTKVLGTDGAIRCFIRHGLLGWSGYVPEDCRQTLFMVPANFAPFIWGYPHRLSARLAEHGTMLVALGDNPGRPSTTGVDDEATLRKLPRRFEGAIWTDRIDRIGPLVHSD
ncbi:glycerophosphodiester phosphodiesterase family protein [Aquamicrobium sp. LC103]|uniref:glycerophosphodiester phosphodiesterase family protein n=1 Tax=Aquamicrobium sp. LC103 TaxID=1120658 RepID=UPI00063E8329|nr:glycerophosphodiester phosphodiesterase family protein [Aquamicrobium sp. LC103]TKT76893.1 glycerophosphodiester phosphodiesterase [Aquamicrobium sp. LC103]